VSAAERVGALKIKKAALQRRRQQLIDQGSDTRLMDRLISNCDKVKNEVIRGEVQQQKPVEVGDVSREPEGSA
jgi:hypothetical protein